VDTPDVRAKAASNGPVLPIGAVARESGLTVETIRYYERLGLLPVPARMNGHSRRYEPAVLTRLTFIARAKALGLSLAEVRELVVATSHPNGCAKVHVALAAHLEEVDNRLRELQGLRKTLMQYARACADALARQSDPTCPLAESIVRAKPPRAAAGSRSRTR
jgi:MerR family mercuric resistance operon transcriptional regulator